MMPDPLVAASLEYWRERLREAEGLQLGHYPESGGSVATVDIAFPANDLMVLATSLRCRVQEVLLAAVQTFVLRRWQQNDFFVAEWITQCSNTETEFRLLRCSLFEDLRFRTLVQGVANECSISQSFPLPADKLEALACEPAEVWDSRKIFPICFSYSEDAAKAFSDEFGDIPKGCLLMFNFQAVDNMVALSVAYPARAFQAWDVQNFAGNVVNLLEAAMRNPRARIGALPMLTETEKNRLLWDFNNTRVAGRHEATVVAFFEEQARLHPLGIALHHKDDTLTYAGLLKKVDCLAAFLVAEGILPEERVGLLVNRGFDMITGMLAIMKAGATYVPIDPQYPPDRRTYIITNSGITTVLTDVPAVAVVGQEHIAFVVIGDVLRAEAGAPVENRSHPDGSAYIIYTSGSTGRPKGVMVRHHSVVNLVTWVNNTYKVSKSDRILFVTSMCFDLSVYDIFGMLAAGGTVVIAGEQDVYDVARLAVLLDTYQITFWDSVPTTFDYMLRSLEARQAPQVLPSLRVVFLSGDWVPVAIARRALPIFPAASVVSLGGATEATVWSNFFPIDPAIDYAVSIPYGKPIDNNTFYILNAYLQPVPQGLEGDLYIGGVGVADGYANEREKTAAAFLPDPFFKDMGGRMYSTGDLGRMLPDGNMEFLGRRDSQVKIRGFRVELGEIEAVAAQCAAVEAVAVTATKDAAGINRLLGYVVAGRGFEKGALIATLREHLPEYMVPTVWTVIAKIPLSANGKVDRKALPVPDAVADDATDAAATETEGKLAAIWQQVLGVAKVRPSDNFFDLGGQSLLAVLLTSATEAAFGGQYNIYTLFKYPTVRTFGTHIEAGLAGGRVWESLVPVRDTGSRRPLYVVHGDGFNVMNFNSLAENLNSDQPVYSLQPRGLVTNAEPLDDMLAIARHYVAEMTAHDPNGPYAIAGYSFGGYVVVEMLRLLQAQGKKVSLVGIFDTDAQNIENKAHGLVRLPRRILRQFPKWAFYLRSFMANPAEAWAYQTLMVRRRLADGMVRLGLRAPEVQQPLTGKMKRIDEGLRNAFLNYKMTPIDGHIVLFKAKKRIYYVDDFKTLGWPNFARKGVRVIEVPGDHKTMFLPPNVAELGRALQLILDEADSNTTKY